MRHQFHQTGIYQNPRTDTIKYSIHDQTRLTAGRIRISHPQARGYGYRGAEAVGDGEEVGGHLFVLWPGGDGQSGAETEAFKSLVEDEDGVKCVELWAGDGEGEPDEYGVEDDAKFEDKDCSHLRRVVFYFVQSGAFVHVCCACEGGFFGRSRGDHRRGGGVVDVGARVGEVVFARGVVVAGRGFWRACSVLEGVAAGRVMFVVVGGCTAKGGEAHGHQFDDEQDEDCHKGYAFHPGVVCDGSGEARVSEGIVGWCEELLI